MATATLFLLMGCQSQINEAVVPAVRSSEHLSFLQSSSTHSSLSTHSLSTHPLSSNLTEVSTTTHAKKGSRIQTPSSINHERVGTHMGDLYSPRPGVLCDHFFCANPDGISYSLTLQFLGKKAATRLHDEGNFDMTAFTFENGIFCDTGEKRCRDNRYYDQQGHHSGKVNATDTKRLFSLD